MTWALKVKLSLCFNWAPPLHEGVLKEWRYCSTHLLTSSVPDGGEWSASRPGRFTSRERIPGIHWVGGWVGPRAGMDAVVNRKIPGPYRDTHTHSPVWDSENSSHIKGQVFLDASLARHMLPVVQHFKFWYSCFWTSTEINASSIKSGELYKSTSTNTLAALAGYHGHMG
jgi:hypothetical protein